MDNDFTALLTRISCPVDHSELKLTDDRQSFLCPSCGWRYKITDGIPDLRPPKAKPAAAAGKK